MKITKKILSVFLSLIMTAGLLTCALPCLDFNLTASAESFTSALPALPDGVSTFNGHSYKRIDTALSWDDAKTACYNAGGHLVTITSAEENAFVTNLLSGSASGAEWIGMYNPTYASGTSGSANYYWITGESKDYLNWNSGEPNDSGSSEACGAIYAGGAWNDLSSTSAGIYYICEWDYTCAHTYDVTTSGTRTIYTCTKCGGTFWVDATNHCAGYNGHFYELRKQNALTWSVANNACVKSGANLISIGDSLENDMAALLVNKTGSTNAWTGYNRSTSDTNYYGPYSWTDGSTNTFTNWNSGEPNGTAEYYCCLWAGTYNDKWNDYGSAGTCGGYICEYTWDPASYLYENCAVTAATCTTDGSWQYKNSSGTVLTTLTPSTTVYGGHKYVYVSGSYSYAQAQLICESMGGHLAVISDASENAAIAAIGTYSANNPFIGLADFDHRGVNGTDNSTQASLMYWVDGSALSYSNWNSGEPNNSNDTDGNYEGFGCMLASGQWNDVYYGYLSGFFCEWENADLPGAATGHNYGAWTYDATTHTRVCANDTSHVETGAHTFHEVINAPTHTAGGGTVFTCSVCGYNYTENATSALADTADRFDSQQTLPSGVSTYGGHSYMLIPSAMSWADAKAACVAAGGHLVTITSSGENDFVTNLISGSAAGAEWIGMCDPGYTSGTASADTCYWITGEPKDYLNWGTGEPNDSGSLEDAATINSAGVWNDLASTSSGIYYICEWDYACAHTYTITTAGTRTVYTCSKCGETFWIDTTNHCAGYNGHFYELRKQNALTWSVAHNACVRSGGDLISIGSSAENDMAGLLVSKAGMNNSWTGFNRSTATTVCYSPYSWTDGSAVNYTNWSSGEPNGTAEYYGCLWSGDYRNKMNDYDASSTCYSYICEYTWDPALYLYDNCDVTAAVCTADGYWQYKNSAGTAVTTITPATTVYGGHKYVYVSGSYTYPQAQLICESMGGHLAIISDAAENAAIAAIGNYSANNPFIGLADFDHLGVFGADNSAQAASMYWVDGSALSYSNWNAGEPNNSNASNGNYEGYGCMLVNGEWNDITNAYQSGFICEWDNADLPGAALGHNYGAYVTTTPPTSTSVGVQTATCANDSTHTLTRPCYYVNFPSGSHYTISDISSNYSELLAADTCTFKLAVDAGYGKNLIVSGSNCTVTGSDGSYSVTSFTGVPTVSVSFEPNNYSVVYDANGGTGAPTAFTATFDQTYYAGAAPVKTGYTFTGWLGSNGTTYQAGDELKNLVSADGGSFSLTAQWTANTYTVSFDGNGATGGAMDDQTMTYDTETALTVNAFTREYTVAYDYNGGTGAAVSDRAAAVFGGWTGSNGNDYTDGQTVVNLTDSGVFTMTAGWTLASVTLPGDAVRTGYIFDGWYDGSTKIETAQYTPGADKTLTAHWTPITYTVSYDANGGTGAPAGFTATYDTAYTVGAAPEMAGHTFTGWLGSNGTAYQAGDELKNLVTADGGSFTLTAQWEINHYDVRFFNYDDTQIGETQSIEYGKDATAPADPTRLYDNNAHYTFNGWTGYTNITAATDITAAFTAAPHSYTYAVKIAPTADAEGLLAGTCTCGKTVTVDIPVLNDTDYTVTTTAATPDAAGNTHYVWNENVTYGVNVTGDIAIPALGYTVSFYQEDDATLIQAQHADTLAGAVAAYDGALPAKDATAQYTYHFDKWVTTADDEAAGTYKAVPTFTSTVNKYDVRFFNYDGTQIGETQSIDYGSDATAPAAPVKASDETNHYTFDGWTGYTNITKNTDITAAFTAMAHSYTYAVTTEPTKTAAGLLTGTCACGHTVTADLPVLSDTDYDLVTVPATTDAAGSETYTWKSNADYGVNVTVVIVIPKTGFTVSFYDESGVTLLDTQTAGSLDDAIAAYSGAAQTKAETAQYSYTFAGWTTTATDVNNGLYKAVAKFDETTRKYTVTFKNDDGTVLDTQSVAYGSGAAAPAEPTKAATAQYSYTFAGWDKTCDNITGDLTVTATYSQTVNTYTVTYYNNDGTVLYTAQVPYGSSVTYAGSAPAYVGEYAKDMEFVGWSVTTDSITGVTSVKAVYKDTGSKLSRFFDKLIDFIIKIRDILLRITKAHGDTYDVNIWNGGKWQ